MAVMMMADEIVVPKVRIGHVDPVGAVVGLQAAVAVPGGAAVAVAAAVDRSSSSSAAAATANLGDEAGLAARPHVLLLLRSALDPNTQAGHGLGSPEAPGAGSDLGVAAPSPEDMVAVVGGDLLSELIPGVNNFHVWIWPVRRSNAPVRGRTCL